MSSTEATSLQSVIHQYAPVTDGNYYTLSGIKTKPTHTGIYLYNGQKTIKR